jgi:transposase-like protein
MGSRKYHNEEWLRTEYVEKRRSTTDMAEECGVSAQTIIRWLKKNGIDRRGQSEAQIAEKQPFHDETWLREQYVNQGRSMQDIADECGVTPSGIKKWIDKFEIETRGSADHLKEGPARFFTKEQNGYEYVASKHDYKTDSAMVHQLVAIAEGANPSKVFSNGRYHIHHKNGHKWDNRPENLELRSSKTHVFEHHHDDKHKTPSEYATHADREELLFELRRLILDWRSRDDSTMEMCSDELDSLLRRV